MSRYLSQIPRRNHAIFCLYFKAKELSISRNAQIYSWRSESDFQVKASFIHGGVKASFIQGEVKASFIHDEVKASFIHGEVKAGFNLSAIFSKLETI